MDKKKESFLVNRLKSVGYAYKGAVYLIRTEASAKIQLALGLLVTLAGFYFNISRTEWILQVICIGMVISLEGVNTAIEYIADFVHPDLHSSIGRIKDIAAGAVFIGAVSAFIVALIIYIPKLL
ncbi:diacylglycerol kinase family protein [Sediminibacter sp. Hel_I_10]|uniref:diacylglycerol kinase family protein n=1 Tax=Sediminibacter sp. Hel_I_10 TaxID=1392490 RepID=UPI00047D3AFC|nr:diacylglycerol kinase family protein [Sediminibacter sp. Hel_I_10]